MDCELCGRSGALVKVKIDKAEFNVCELCSKHGKRIGEPVICNYTPTKTSKQSEEILIESYGRAIQLARNKLSLTQEQLASQVREHLSVIQAAETNKRLEIQVAHKLEKALNINLVEII